MDSPNLTFSPQVQDQHSALTPRVQALVSRLAAHGILETPAEPKPAAPQPAPPKASHGAKKGRNKKGHNQASVTAAPREAPPEESVPVSLDALVEQTESGIVKLLESLEGTQKKREALEQELRARGGYSIHFTCLVEVERGASFPYSGSFNFATLFHCFRFVPVT